MEDPFKNSFNQEKLPEFLYTDNSEAGAGAVIFRCNAASIEEADKMFEAEMKYDPTIDEKIGCMSAELETN